MSNFEKPLRSPVTLPLMALYGAYVSARAAGDRLTSQLAAAFEPLAYSKPVAAFLAAVPAGGHCILPFVRDRVDVLVAAALTAEAPAGELRLYSDLALVEAGYIRVTRSGVTYVDRVVAANKKEVTRYTELLAVHRTADLSESLLAIDRDPPLVRSPNAGEAMLEVHLPALDVFRRYAGKQAIDLALVRAKKSKAASVVLRRLGAARVMPGSEGFFGLGLRPEAVMEAHAAALDGQYLLMEAPGLRVLAPLPDFTGEVATTEATLDPACMWEASLGFSSEAAVAVGGRLARQLHRRHRWCLPREIKGWLVEPRNAPPG